MKLVLREYLSMLKESGELDSLLHDLLLAMGIDPLSRPTIGARQFGVDLPAVGIDPEDGRQKLFLFVVKQGDLTRSTWDTGAQAVRPSLNEIFDIYFRTQVRPEHSGLPKKIVLVINGDIKQNVAPNWAGYVSERTGAHPEYGEIELSCWDGDKLALLLNNYLLDEYLFPESAQHQIRKTIALADQNEEEPRFFYDLVEGTLFQRDLPTEMTAAAHRKRQHALRLLNLSVNIVLHWCEDTENLRPALLCAERAALRAWDWMRLHERFDKATLEEFARLFNSYLRVARRYALKIQRHCFVRDGLFRQGGDEAEYSLRTFEVIGILGELGFALACMASSAEGEIQQRLLQEGNAVAQMLVGLIANNPSALTPVFDGHAIDIGLGLLALASLGASEQAIEWLDLLSDRVLFAYRIGRHFPISSDSYDDLVALQFGEGLPREEVMELSTLVPLLADWHAVLDLPDAYRGLQKTVVTVLKQTDLQMWFPDDSTDNVLYRANAGHRGGRTFGSIQLPEQLDDLKKRIVRIGQQSVFESLSCIKYGWPVLGLIASRHFRTPLIPGYWQRIGGSSQPAEIDAVAEMSELTTGQRARGDSR